MMNRSIDDRGSALVAAVAVAMIGVALSTVVVAQAIVITRDAGRDATRTSAVHAAEAALDSVTEMLSVQKPCAVTFENVAQGTVAVDVDVEITYADANGPLTDCVAGQIQGTPVRATIVATSTPVGETFGVTPQRSMEAAVQLEPRAGHSAAIFSATAPETGAGFELAPLIPADTANVWVDSGDFNCHSNVNIEGDLTVVQGTITMQNNCTVDGHVWAQSGVVVNSNAAYRSGDGMTVRNGNLLIHNAGQVFYGDIFLGGTLEGWNSQFMEVIGGQVFENATIPNLDPMGLPVIGVVPSDWAGFTFKDRNGWKNDMMAGTVGGINVHQTGQLDNCTLANWMANTQTGGLAIVDVPPFAAYDLTGRGGPGCSSSLVFQNVRLQLTGDVVFFVRDIQSYNPMEIVSADGQPHNVWFIVPHRDHPSMHGGYNSGNIGFHSANNKFQDPINIFIYTPGEVQFHNSTYTNGQVYANKVFTHTQSEFRYTPINVPGVDLAVGASSSGYYVTLEYKREVS